MKKIVFIIFSFCLLLPTNYVFASVHKNIWQKWAVYNPQSDMRISHQEWQAFLDTCLVTNEEGINLIQYPHLNEANLDLLQLYITRMSKINIEDYNRNEQLAYWINLYNALTVQIIADYYPVDSVQEVNISPGLFSVGPWKAHLLMVEGTQLSLDDILNRIIRPIWNDPRALYALNDGSIGAANLSKQVYQGSTIEQQLNEAATNYINSKRGAQLIDGKLVLSKTYDWYFDDFGGNMPNLIFHLSQFAKEPLRHYLQKITTVNSYIYNWHLNSTYTSIS